MEGIKMFFNSKNFNVNIGLYIITVIACVFLLRSNRTAIINELFPNIKKNYRLFISIFFTIFPIGLFFIPSIFNSLSIFGDFEPDEKFREKISYITFAICFFSSVLPFIYHLVNHPPF